jgi:hypothetical protein
MPIYEPIGIGPQGPRGTAGPVWTGSAGLAIDASGYGTALIAPASMAQASDLPSAAAPAVAGTQFAVRNTSTEYSLLIRAQAGENIGGLPQRHIMPSGFLLLQSDGTNWLCVSNPHPPGTVIGRYTRTASATVTYTSPIDFDTPVYAPIPALYTVTPSARFIPPEPGWYRVHGHITSPSTASGGLIKAFLKKNDVDVAIYGMSGPPSGWWGTPAVDDVVWCNGSTDYIQLYLGTTGSVRSDYSVVMFSYA